MEKTGASRVRAEDTLPATAPEWHMRATVFLPPLPCWQRLSCLHNKMRAHARVFFLFPRLLNNRKHFFCNWCDIMLTMKFRTGFIASRAA